MFSAPMAFQPTSYREGSTGPASSSAECLPKNSDAADLRWEKMPIVSVLSTLQQPSSQPSPGPLSVSSWLQQPASPFLHPPSRPLSHVLPNSTRTMLENPATSIHICNRALRPLRLRTVLALRLFQQCFAFPRFLMEAEAESRWGSPSENRLGSDPEPDSGASLSFI